MDIKNVDLFFSENPNPMWIYDSSDLSILEVNESALDLYGYTRKEMLSLSIADLRSPIEVPALKAHLTKEQKQNNSGIWKHQKKNGEVLFARVLSTPVTIENKDYKLVVAQDVTQKIEYQEKYRMIYEHSLDGIMLTHPNGDILEANRAACDILGMTEAEIIEAGREGIVVKDSKLEKALKMRSETGKFFGELTFFHKSGRKIPVELTSSVFTNYAGEKRTTLIFRDISSQKKDQEALSREKEFTDVTINSMPGVFFVLNEQGRVIRWNNNAADVFGLTDQEIEGRQADHFVHDDDKERVSEEIQKVLREGSTTVELKLNTAGNLTSTYHFVANRIHQDGQTYIIGNGIDVTEQKELEGLIHSLLAEESKQRKRAETDLSELNAIFEKAPSPKCMLEGPEFKIVTANQSYREIMDQKNILGKKLEDVNPGLAEQGILEILTEVYQTGKPYIGEQVPIKVNKEGSEVFKEYIFNLIFQPLFDSEGQVHGIFVEAIDVSDQISYQLDLEESLKEKQILLAEIHHRVKNNLAIVISMMELQALESLDPELILALRTGQQRIKTIALIHEILYQSKNLSYVDFGHNISKLINSLQMIYDESDKISVDVQSDSIQLNINQAIPAALIVNEILTNAYKHAFVGKQDGRIDVRVQENGSKVKIVIGDNGVGIPDNLHLESSSSLGMTLINELSQQLSAGLEMSGGNGTRFVVSFEKGDINGAGSNLPKSKMAVHN